MKNFKDLTYVALMYIEHPVHQSSRPIIYFVNNFKISLPSNKSIKFLQNVKENNFFHFYPYKIPKNVRLAHIYSTNINVALTKFVTQHHFFSDLELKNQ